MPTENRLILQLIHLQENEVQLRESESYSDKS